MAGENKCGDCGQFVAWRDLWGYVPYGGPLDTEPPPDEFICLDCLILSGGIKAFSDHVWQGPTRCGSAAEEQEDER